MILLSLGEKGTLLASVGDEGTDLSQSNLGAGNKPGSLSSVPLRPLTGLVPSNGVMLLAVGLPAPMYACFLEGRLDISEAAPIAEKGIGGVDGGTYTEYCLRSISPFKK